MSDVDSLDADGTGDAALAGEFVLGLLDPAEAAACKARLSHDLAFAQLTEDWERKFAALDQEFEPVLPPAGLKRRIEARLFGRQPSGLARLWSSAGLWRGLAVASLALALYLGTLPAPAPLPGVPDSGQARLISALASVESDVALIALLDREAGVLNLSRTSGAAQPGGALELWLVQGEQAPVSLGLLPDSQVGRIALGRALADRIEAGATLAVSAEPEGGSPTGAPTGPVVAAGTVTEI